MNSEDIAKLGIAFLLTLLVPAIVGLAKMQTAIALLKQMVEGHETEMKEMRTEMGAMNNTLTRIETLLTERTEAHHVKSR